MGRALLPREGPRWARTQLRAASTAPFGNPLPTLPPEPARNVIRRMMMPLSYAVRARPDLDARTTDTPEVSLYPSDLLSAMQGVLAALADLETYHEVELVAAEAVEVLGQVGACASQGFRGDRGAVPVGRNLVECARHADGGVEDEQVGDQVVVLDHLALLVALGRGGQPAAAERDPLGVAVEQLALVGRGLDHAPELDRR